MEPVQCDLQPEIQETHRTTHTGTTTRCRTQRRNQFAHETTAATTAAHTRYFSSPAATTSHGKMHGFVLRLPPQNKAHATFMQPSQCILQHDLANPACIYAHGNRAWQQSCSHSNAIRNQRLKKRIELRTQEQPLVAEHRGETNSRMKRPQPQPPHTRGTLHRRLQPLYTEKRMVSCSGFLPKTSPMQHSCSQCNAFRIITWLTRISLRAWQQSVTTIMEPVQCDLQPEIQETHRTTHTGTTTRCRTQRRNQFAHETTAATTAAHTRYFSSPAATTSHGKMHGFVLRLPPQNKAHATFMQPSQCILQHDLANPACIYAHGNRAWQQSCSHSNAICNHRLKKRTELRTQEQPLVAEHRGGTNSRMKRLQPQPPHTRGTIHRRAKPHYTEKGKVSCAGFLPKTKPMQHSCSQYNAFCSITWLTRIFLRTWRQSMTTIMEPFQCDPQPEIKETHRTTQTGTTTRCRTQRRNQFAHETTAAATAAHTRYLASPAAATLHGKTDGFVLRLPSPKPAPCNIHAASAMRFASSRG